MSDDGRAARLRRAGLHGCGRLGLSNTIWDDKPGPLQASGSGCASTHYLTERDAATVAVAR